MIRSLQQVSIGLAASILISSGFDSNALAANDDAIEWVITGTARVKMDIATINRLTWRSTLSDNRSAAQNISIVWSDALLTSDGRQAIPIEMNVQLTAGLSMAVGEHTPYPGLITKIDDVQGQIVDLQTRRKFALKLSERGSWTGKLIHSNSHGPGHLALELPFSLIDELTGALVAENNLVVVFDISSPFTPVIKRARMSPTPYSDLRLSTTDIGSVIRGGESKFAYSNRGPAETYDAQVTVTRVSAILDQNQHSDLFSTESLSACSCGNEQFMELEMRSPGFAQFGQMRSPPFTLRLRYVPALIAEGRLAYLDPIDGQLILYYRSSSRLVEIGPGNHGDLSSQAILEGDKTILRLGIALREVGRLPVVARLDVACTSSEAELKCADLRLSTAVGIDDLILSPRSLSDLMESQSTFADFGTIAD